MSTLHPASLQHTDRDIKYRGEGAQGALGAWREQGVRPDSPPAPGPPLPSGSVRDVADRQMRSLHRREGRARGAGAATLLSKRCAEHRAQRHREVCAGKRSASGAEARSAGGRPRGVHKEEAGPLPAPTPDSNSGHLEQDSFS